MEGRRTPSTLRRALLVAAPAFLAPGVTTSAFAQDAAPHDAASHEARAPDAGPAQQSAPTVSRKKAISPNATINLINLLVQQGVLKEEQATALIKQAEDETYVARESAKGATAKADEAAKTASAAAAAAMPPGTKRVTYVPEIVKKQLRDELRNEVMVQARDEGWASPGKVPEWASRIRLFGDFRGRYQGNFFPSGNATDGSLVNYNAINTGSPWDYTSSTLPPSLSANADRNRFLLRARLGAEADLTNGFSTLIRFGTGQDSSPVSGNQTLGASGGNFSKYAVWLDRGYLKYEPNEDVALRVGRFDNPFYAPTDLVWYNDLGFDGVAAQGRYEIYPGFAPFAVAGAFPIFNTDLNFATNQGVKYASTDKYLFGGQLGFVWNAAENLNISFGGGFYDFSNVQGQLSAPCVVTTAADLCSTDALRPSFAQKGNTYMALRDIIPVYNSAGALGPQFQYFGLASAFREVILTGEADLANFNPVHILLDGEYVNNVGFNRAAVAAVAVNNLGPSANNNPGAFDGGNVGYMARVTVGYPKIRQLWDWNVYLAYKYLQSDATVDAFTDPDFGFGGTNLKGYIVGANLGLSTNVWMTAKWMSGSTMAGPPYAVDTIQLDLNAKF
jgi:hypothetical protein